MKQTKQVEVYTEHKLNDVIYIETKRPNGSIRIQQDFQFCPTMTEQHTGHLTDINYLMEKFKPDEIAAYIHAKNQHRMMIEGHDFASEPDLQDAKNINYRLRQSYLNLPDDVKNHFQNHLEFLKFIDNPANQDKMLKLGLMTKKQIAENTTPVTTTTQEAKEQ